MTAPPRVADDEGPRRPPVVRGAFPDPEKRGLLPILVSACLHVILIWILIMMTAAVADPEVTKQLVAFLSPALLPGGGGGGGNYGAVPKAAPPPPPEEKPKPVVPPPPMPVPTVVPTVIPPVVAPEPVPTSPVAAAGSTASSGSGGGTGGGMGTGNGTGTGSGVGPGSGSGRGGGYGEGGKKVTQPQSRQLILPPLDVTPKELRGKQIEVTFYVEINGTVSKVTTDPVIKDKKFAKTFDDTMKGYRWDAGRDSTGKKVPMSATIFITLQ